MVDVEKLSDAELRTKLLEFGFPVMPITGTTRKVMVKKLKMLLENKEKISNENRRSLGRYSSEEESDSDVKQVKSQKNRRITMAAPTMPAPTARGLRKTQKLDEISEPENSPKREVRTTTTSTTTRTHKILKSAHDEFDTGSESESDVQKLTNDVGYNSGSPIKASLSSSFASRYSPPKSPDSSYSPGRNVSFNTASPGRYSSFTVPSASDYAENRLNQIRSRLSLGSPSYDRPSYVSTPVEKVEKEETPFLSNFTKRLSTISKRNDDVKEHDANGASSYSNTRSYLGSYRNARGRDAIYDYKSPQSGILKNNFVSFAVLAGAGLFFLFVAIVYLGLRSDTSVGPSGYNVPYCDKTDPNARWNENCVVSDSVDDALNLLAVLKPELTKRAVANRCFDVTIKPQMTEDEIVTFCRTNFGIKDEKQIRRDLRTLEILSFANPDWTINVVQRNDNNGGAQVSDIVESMEQLMSNYGRKYTSLVIFEPSLPLFCSISNVFSSIFYKILILATIFAIVYASALTYKYYVNYANREKKEISNLVERIVDILQANISEDSNENFAVINHVRDMILPMQERKKKAKLWLKAVDYINENESRVRTEVQTVAGEPYEVWRWIGSANLSRSGEVTDFKYRSGRRIVDVDYLINEVLKFPHRRFFFCSSGNVSIKNEVREGFFSIYILVCNRCKKEHVICSEDPDSELMDVNLAFLAGIVSLKLELYQLNELCSSLQLPKISQDSYDRYLEEIFNIYNESKSSECSFSDASSATSSTPKMKLEEVKKRVEELDLSAKKENFLRELEKNHSEIERSTIDQRDCELWFDERRKRLTASNFGRICKLLDKTSRKTLVNDLLNSKFKGNIYTEYGNKNEQKAIEDFERIIGEKVHKCGLFIHKKYPFLAATPDGLLGNKAIVEIKCPYKAKDGDVIEAIDEKKISFGTIENGAFRLKREDKYYYQVQGQLMVTGRDICYFIVWTPRGLVYEKIEKDEVLFEKMLGKLKAFYFDHFLPTLLREI